MRSEPCLYSWEFPITKQRMCLGTFSQPARSFTTYFLFARVRILPEAFYRIGKQFPIRKQVQSLYSIINERFGVFGWILWSIRTQQTGNGAWRKKIVIWKCRIECVKKEVSHRRKMQPELPFPLRPIPNCQLNGFCLIEKRDFPRCYFEHYAL